MLNNIFVEDKNFYNKYKAESLKKIQISLIVILIFIFFSVILFTKPDLKLIYSLITLVGILVVGISFYYQKKKKYSEAVFVLIASTVIISWLPLIFDPSIRNGDFIPIFYLVVPILLASLFINSKRTILIAIIQMFASFVVISTSRQLQLLNWISYAIFYLIIVIISIISKYMYNKEIKKNNIQSERLKKTNKKLETLNNSIMKSKEEVERAAYYDALTSLNNALKLKKDVSEMISENEKFIAIQFNINNFRGINEVYGYIVGDSVLKEVADILCKNIDEKVVYRWSGDEFIILIIDSLEIELFEFLKRIEEDLDDHIEISNFSLKIDFSCGIIKVPEDVNDFDKMLLFLNLTTEKAKNTSEKKWELFNDSISYELLEQNHIKETILESLKNSTFYFEGQPIYNVENNEIVCLELLIRTEARYDDTINSMINLAIKSNYILDIDMWVLENAFFNLTNSDNWKEYSQISINLSPQTFQSYNFLNSIYRLIDDYAVDPNKICFEITEHTSFIDINQALLTMKELKKLGFSLALDDFGVMYSSLSYLVELPYDYVKIDRGFIDSIHENVKKQSLVKSLITLSEELDIKVIAEGVTKESELKVLEGLGVEYIQGYYYQKPFRMETIKK